MRLDDYLQRENGWPDLIIAGSARNCGRTSRNKRAVRRKEKKGKKKVEIRKEVLTLGGKK